MKKKILSILLFILMMFYIKPVDALENSSIICDKSNISPGEVVNCYLSTTSSDNINEIKSEISCDKSALSIVSITGINGFVSNSNTSIDLTTTVTKSLNNIKVARLKIKANESAGNHSISLSSLNASTSLYTLSNNNKLSNLGIQEYAFKFDPNTYNYEKNVTKSSVTINASLQDRKAKFKEGYGPRKVDVNFGENIFKIIVVSESNKERTYTLKLNRQDARSKNNNLSALTVSKGTLSPKFRQDILNYTVNAKNENEIKIDAKLADSKSSFVKEYEPKKVKLKDGVNVVKLSIKAENGDVKTYTITINKGLTTSNNSFLKTLTIEGVNFNFNKNKFEYSINVDKNVKSLNVDAIAESNTSDIIITGNDNLKKDGKIKITVTSESGMKTEYIVNVKHVDDVNEENKSTKLKNIFIEGYDLKFDSNVYDYTLSIKNTSRLQIKATPYDPSSTVEIKGNRSLKDGSVIYIVVTDDKTNEQIYRINIEKSNSNTYIFLAILLAIILIISVIAKIFYDKNKKNKSYEEDLTLDRSQRVIIK